MASTSDIQCLISSHITFQRYYKVIMPKPKHKKNAFIDKKASTSFHLVHRSQKVMLDKS